MRLPHYRPSNMSVACTIILFAGLMALPLEAAGPGQGAAPQGGNAPSGQGQKGPAKPQMNPKQSPTPSPTPNPIQPSEGSTAQAQRG
jgi:hypothetical protein